MKPSNPRKFPLVQGRKYRVTWKSAMHRRMREFVGVFLSEHTDGTLAFSLRPAAGTTEMAPFDVVQCVEVPDSTPVYSSRRL